MFNSGYIVRRRSALEIGGFVENFRFPGGEDPELSFRLLQAGYRLESASWGRGRPAASWGRASWGRVAIFH